MCHSNADCFNITFNTKMLLTWRQHLWSWVLHNGICGMLSMMPMIVYMQEHAAAGRGGDGGGALGSGGCCAGR